MFGESKELKFPSTEAAYRKKPFPVDLSCASDPLSIDGNAQGSVKSDGDNQTAARDTANCQKITRNQGTLNGQNPSNEAGPDSNVGCINGQSHSNGQGRSNVRWFCDDELDPNTPFF